MIGMDEFRRCMQRNHLRPFKTLKKVLIPISAFILFAFSPIEVLSSSNDLAGINETPVERELYNTLPGESQKGGIIDATNPMELMNRLRRATAMDDATMPSDAIDAAIRALEDSNVNSN